MEEQLRYARNLGPISPEEQTLLRSCRVCVVGCGGLGGFLTEYLGRIGVGFITVADGDRFDETNLNRQLLSSEENLGMSKAAEAKKRLEQINSSIHVEATEQFLSEENASSILEGHDLILDALDSIPHRLMLQQVCRELEIPLIHGAVEGWFGQVTTVFPGDNSLSRIYPGPSQTVPGGEVPGTLSFVPGLIASLQAAEAVRLLLGKEPALRRKVLFADLLANRFDILSV